MRRIVLVVVLVALCVSLMSATTAEARLFWQTYGSTIPSVGGSGNGGCGAGCTWNWNQDYFVPRYPSSGQYGLFSPCKTSRATSPACKGSHPFYPGYCGIYGPCHYGWRNHVYKKYCGCSPIEVCRGPWRTGCSNGCQTSSCQAAACEQGCFEYSAGSAAIGYLPNVESSGMEILGSISVEGDGLLANIDLTPAEGPDEQRVFLDPRTIEPGVSIPALLGLENEKSTQPLPLP